jgi:hypothetical protein
MIGLAFGALSSLGTIGQFAGNLMGVAARRSQMQDSIRALEMKKSQALGLAAAKSGASGVEGTSSSTQEYLKGLGAEYDRALATQRSVMGDAGLAGTIGAVSGLLGGAAGTTNELGKLNNWWGA